MFNQLPEVQRAYAYLQLAKRFLLQCENQVITQALSVGIPHQLWQIPTGMFLTLKAQFLTCADANQRGESLDSCSLGC